MKQSTPFYLDCNATAPMEPGVIQIVRRYLEDDFGNAGSQSHLRGAVAKKAVQKAREQVAKVVQCKSNEVIFTSGATESNNISILGLRHFVESKNPGHIVTTTIEHKAVLEPIHSLNTQGVEVTYLPCDESGRINPTELKSALRPDTFLVSVMHINNETGVEQPIEEICQILGSHSAYLHTDAAQGFGKSIQPLCHPRIDLISISGHKIYGPKGVGALITRRRGQEKPPLQPLMYGGGQERGLRPGTLPVALIAGLGEAAELALTNSSARNEVNYRQRSSALALFQQLGGQINGELAHVASHTINVSFPELNSEAVMVALKGLADLSNGSACTSSNYEASHVLKAMGLDEERIEGALRFSWSHLTGEIDWAAIADRIKMMM